MKKSIKLKSQPRRIFRLMFGIGIMVGLLMAMYIYPIIGTNAQSEGDVIINDEEISLYGDFMNDVDPDESDIIKENFSEENDGDEGTEKIYNTRNSIYGLTTFEKAFQEVAYAYYMRGLYIHYNIAKGKSDIIPSPEESTCQDYNYMACGFFVMNVFKELLDIDLSYSDAPYHTYAKNEIGKRKEVIGYGEKSGNNLYWYDGSKDASGNLNLIVNPSQSYVIGQLRIGDILRYEGHVMLVYDLIYDDTGNVVDAYLLHSFQRGVYYPKSKGHGSKRIIYDKSGNKHSLAIGHGPWSNLYYNIYDRTNKSGYEEEGILEGTVTLEKFTERARLGKQLNFNYEKSYEIVGDYEIIRLVTTNEEGKDILNLSGLSAFKTPTINDGEVMYSDSVHSRLKYSKLYIEKTVDKRDNNIVEPDEELTYKIVVKNESKKNYENDLIIKENIDTDLVENLSMYSYTKNGSSTNVVQLIPNNENQLQWNIGKLNSGDVVIIEYTVKVRTGHIGETIESTGLVDNIPSGIVKNKIGKNTNKGEELKESFNNLSGSYTGKILINKIYEEVYGVNLGLNNLKILTNNSGDESGLIFFNNKWGSWSSWDDSTYMSISKKNIYGEDKKNIFSNMVLNSYFNALYKGGVIRSYNPFGNEIKVQTYVIPAIGLRKNDPDNRAKTIFSADFKTGDILIYKNENDIWYSEGENITVTGEDGSVLFSGQSTMETYLTYEDGEYAYIYIDGKFVGVNLGNDLTATIDDRNEFTTGYYNDIGLTLYAGRTSNVEITDELKEFLHYQTLFGKDAYVILRPSLVIRNITYELDGGTNNDENPDAFILGREVELNDPVKDGFIFQGWYTDSEYTNQVYNTNELIDDVVLYAKWENNSCTFDGNTINNGGSVTGYRTNAVAYGETCESETRTCINGELNGSYGYASCTVGEPASCTFNGSTINNGESVTGYRTNAVAYGEICESETRTCINGELNGSYGYSSCTVGEPASCIFNGNTINHGESVTGYRTNVVSYGQGCESEIRTCINGALSGSFGYLSCTIQSNGGGGRAGLKKDKCPNGDYSDSYYDGTCEKNGKSTHNVPNINVGSPYQRGEKLKYDTLRFNPYYSDEMNKAYQFAYYYGITTKETIKDADVNGKLTRIAMAKMLSQYAINVLGKEPDKTRQNAFVDVSNKLDSNYDNGVTLAYQLGIMGINMSNNKFRPYDIVNRAEFVTALSRLLYGIEDGKDKYYSTHMNLLEYLGIITNTNPKMEELRGYVMIMLMRSEK